MTYTTIRCLTCTSTVPWGPHCPECGAYLEFAGDPPWQPAPEGYERPESSDAASSEQESDAASAELIVSEAAPIPVTVVTGAPVTHPPVTNPRPASRSTSFAGTIGVLVAGAIVSPVIWWFVGPVLGIATAVVFLVWALVLWPRRVVEAPPIEPQVPVEVVEVVAVTEVVDAVTVPEVQARPPQALGRRTVEVTRPLVTQGPEGDVPCPSCQRLNVTGRAYCLWCGVTMTNASVAPDTVPILESSAPDRAAEKKQRRRGPSRSWRTPILVLTMIGVVVSAIIFSLFGPGAFQVRFGLTNIYQLINQFIDPYAGNPVNIEYVVATSSTRGTSPENILGPDASTFWVSAPSTTEGRGEELFFLFEDTYTINRMVINPGIQNGVFDTRAVSTPRTITLTFADGTQTSARLDLVQTDGDLQQLVRFPKVTTPTVRLRIDSVYPPRTPTNEMLGEVAISGVRFLTPPAPPSFVRLPNDIQPRSSLPGTTS